MTMLPLRMSVEYVCQRLGLSDVGESFSQGWDESGRMMPSGTPPFLQREFVTSGCRELGFGGEATKAMIEASHEMANDTVLTRYAWHVHWLAFESGLSTSEMPRVPSLVKSVHAPGHQFYAVVALGGLATAKQAHAKRCVPDNISRATLNGILIAMEVYKENYGTYGLSEGSFNYFHRLFQGELFHIERLQFHYNTFRSKLRVFRRASDGKVIALSEAGVRYREDGERYVPSRGDIAEGTWASSLFETPGEIAGYPVTPRGKAIKSKITLDKNEWQCELRTGDSVLQIHIPGGGPMDFAACGESLAGAAQFFDQCFPERSFKGFACNSWLLDDQLEMMLPEHSNLVRFLREFYRFPTSGTTNSALYWVFGTVPEDLTQAPQNSTLRRKIVEHVLSGRNMVGGGGFILRNDLNWGKQVYRTQGLDVSG